MAKSYRHKSILLTIKQFDYYEELIKQPQVHTLRYYNGKKKKLKYMFPEKLFSHLTNPNLGSPTRSYRTQVPRQAWRKQFCSFNPTGWSFMPSSIGSPSQLKLNYHGLLGSDTQFFCHSLFLTTEFLVFSNALK